MKRGREDSYFVKVKGLNTSFSKWVKKQQQVEFALLVLACCSHLTAAGRRTLKSAGRRA
jgi:hypothetical protein